MREGASAPAFSPTAPSLPLRPPPARIPLSHSYRAPFPIPRDYLESLHPRSHAIIAPRNRQAQRTDRRAYAYRIDNGPERATWSFEPKLSSIGAKLTPLVYGDISSAPEVHIFESQWDMLCETVNRGNDTRRVRWRGKWSQSEPILS